MSGAPAAAPPETRAAPLFEAQLPPQGEARPPRSLRRKRGRRCFAIAPKPMHAPAPHSLGRGRRSAAHLVRRTSRRRAVGRGSACGAGNQARRRGRAHAAHLARFFPHVCGSLLAGAVPVPIYPPVRADRIAEYAERQSAILRNANVRLLVTFREAARVARLLGPRVPSLAAS